MAQAYIRKFSEIGAGDVALVGGKNASLGEMLQHLGSEGVPVPDGFAITVPGYRRFLTANGLDQKIQTRLADLRDGDIANLSAVGAEIRGWIRAASLPDDLAGEIARAYSELGGVSVAVRSSATAEDLADASFAGQQDTFLNVRGVDALCRACVNGYASLFNDRAISYRTSRHFDHMQTGLSLGVQMMVRSDLACAGVLFTLDTESGFRDLVLINAAYGLGENVVKGAVNPDEYGVFKPKLDGGFRPIVKRRLGDKQMRMIYGNGAEATRNVDVPEAERARFALSDDEVLTLARYGVRIEAHYSKRNGQPTPMDIEWAKDGETGKLYIVQARPETVHARAETGSHETYRLEGRGPVIVTGVSVGSKIASGHARIVRDVSDMGRVQPGEILVADMTDPDWEPVMKISAAIVTNRGGRTCHAAIVARELGVPAVVGTGEATKVIQDGQSITVSCAEGEVGRVYEGALPFHAERIPYNQMARPKTRVMMNVGNPELAFTHAALPNDGVGLARLEFIIARSIQAHPRALLEYDQLDANTRVQIDKLIAGYPDRRSYFVSRLAEGVGTIAAAFHPKPVVVRLSDFKSNEYASLLGGERFEPREENPMLGLRGASRYYDDTFRDSFAMECEALRYVRQDMGLDNVIVMIPFVRSVEEGRRVLALMETYGLKRGENGLKVYVMCEIPANALLAEEFLEHFDGYSIGSNDLTQLTLGVDRDSGLLKGFDERNPAVLKLMEMAIRGAHIKERPIGICGQAPSDYPQITEWLVAHGIDSISLNPDTVVPMTQVVLAAEAKQRKA